MVGSALVGPNGGIRAPGWFVAALLAAAGLMGVGWWAANLRITDLEDLKRQMVADHITLERRVEDLMDSLATLRRLVRTNTARTCRLEAAVKLPQHTVCDELFGPYEPRPLR